MKTFHKICKRKNDETQSPTWRRVGNLWCLLSLSPSGEARIKKPTAKTPPKQGDTPVYLSADRFESPVITSDYWLWMCLRSSASSDPAVPGGHEDPGGGEGGDRLQVLWSYAHQLHLAEVQETSETHAHTEAGVISYWSGGTVITLHHQVNMLMYPTLCSIMLTQK